MTPLETLLKKYQNYLASEHKRIAQLADNYTGYDQAFRHGQANAYAKALAQLQKQLKEIENANLLTHHPAL